MIVARRMFLATKIIEEAARSSLGGDILRRVLVEPTVDSDGHEALGVTIVLNDADLSGKQALDTLVGIYQALVASGDDRFPIIEYATEHELADDGDPES